MKLTFKIRLIFTLLVTLLIWGHIFWDHLHGGIPTHYILHDPEMPGIPNWAGGIVLPFFTWFLLHRINKRETDFELRAKSTSNPKNTILKGISAFCIAIVISVLFTSGANGTDHIMIGIFMISFIFPLYKSEYLLGWVLGSAFTFGAIIPIVFGSMLAFIFFLFYQLRRKVFSLVAVK